jgi:GT2 family glycosyltransferase
MISVCVPVHRPHGDPNIETLDRSLPAALGDLEGELIVTLNGITSAVAGVPSSAITVDLGTNRGVAPGWNAAAQAAHGQVLVFTNDDVVPGKDSLALMAWTLSQHPEAGVVAPVGTRWDLSGPSHVGWVELNGRPAGELEPCDVISGWLFAVRREVYEAVGGFDESYAPCSYEEVDFCTAVRKRLGLQCYVVAGVKHQHGKSGISLARPWARVRYEGRSETLWSIQRRNRRYFRRKWTGAV